MELKKPKKRVVFAFGKLLLATYLPNWCST